MKKKKGNLSVAYDSNALNIYTDGSSFQSPRAGGIGIRFKFPESIHKEDIDFEFNGFKGATNNQMELQACIVALQEASVLEELSQINRIIIHTDSMYVNANVIRARFDWSTNKWNNRDGAPVLNANQWKQLLKEIQNIKRRVDFKWVKGHSKNKDNKAVDKLAKESANKAFNNPLSYVSVRKKKSTKNTEKGSVKMLGQKISIRIITCQYLRPQKTWKYKYEVIAKSNQFCENIDEIFVTKDINGIHLRDGHSYSVRFNLDNNFPQIVKIFREI